MMKTGITLDVLLLRDTFISVLLLEWELLLKFLEVRINSKIFFFLHEVMSQKEVNCILNMGLSKLL